MEARPGGVRLEVTEELGVTEELEERLLDDVLLGVLLKDFERDPEAEQVILTVLL